MLQRCEDIKVAYYVNKLSINKLIETKHTNAVGKLSAEVLSCHQQSL